MEEGGPPVLHQICIASNLCCTKCMSISNNVSALNKYFTRIWSSRTYSAMRAGSKRVLEKIPAAWEFARRTEEHMKGMVAPGTLFEELGFNYYGPIDGHDLDELVLTLQNLKKLTLEEHKNLSETRWRRSQVTHQALTLANSVTSTRSVLFSKESIR